MSKRNRERRLNREVKPRSVLHDKVGLFVGFGFLPHPSKHGWFAQVCFYKVENQWVICLSEGQGDGDLVAARNGLGLPAFGKDFAPFAIRAIESTTSDPLNLDVLKKLMGECFPEAKLEWYEGDIYG